MASPHSESFYCIPTTSLSTADRRWYSAVSLLSASLSLSGSMYMLCTFFKHLKQQTGKARSQFSDTLFYLALADLIACVGVICRSVALLIISHPKNYPEQGNNTNTTSCSGSHPSHCTPSSQHYLYYGVLIEFILRFGYIATFIWTLLYPVDTLLKLKKQKDVNLIVYHAITWTLSAALAGSNVVVVFVNVGVPCAGENRLIGSYFLMYMPLVVVMVTNPFLYRHTTRAYREELHKTGKYSTEERQKVNKAKRNFMLYTVVFYVCWLPSVVNLIAALITHFTGVVRVPFPIWIINGICNPLQGFLNSLSYGKMVPRASRNGQSSPALEIEGETASGSEI